MSVPGHRHGRRGRRRRADRSGAPRTRSASRCPPAPGRAALRGAARPHPAPRQGARGRPLRHPHREDHRELPRDPRGAAGARHRPRRRVPPHGGAARPHEVAGCSCRAPRWRRTRQPPTTPGSIRAPSWCGGSSSTRSTRPPGRSWRRATSSSGSVFVRRARAERPAAARGAGGARRRLGVQAHRGARPRPRHARARSTRTRSRPTGSRSATPSPGWRSVLRAPAARAVRGAARRPPGARQRPLGRHRHVPRHPRDGEAEARPHLPGRASTRPAARGGDPRRGARHPRRRRARPCTEDYR